MTMQLEFTPEDLEELNYERYRHPLEKADAAYVRAKTGFVTDDLRTQAKESLRRAWDWRHGAQALQCWP